MKQIRHISADSFPLRPREKHGVVKAINKLCSKDFQAAVDSYCKFWAKSYPVTFSKMKRTKERKKLLQLYNRLYSAIGPRHWWPADSPFEVIIGAILTQNTSWKNVEKAIHALKERDLLDPLKILTVEEALLAETIKSSGFFNIKAKRIKNFIHFLFACYQGSLEKMFSEKLSPLREKLLKINGVGPETADSILLYAGGKPIFVVDAYTKRIFERHNLISESDGYDETQSLFMENLEKNVSMFNEYHALMVYVGKYFCKRTPQCGKCPAKGI